MAAPQSVLDLVARYERNRADYRGASYNETQVRREFLDPLLEALGWDVNNRRGYAESYKDVVHEAALRIGGRKNAPDYSFRVGLTRKFFLEAKRPSVDVGSDPDPALQVRRYSWSAKLPIGVVSNFEEFVVYDCRARPRNGDKAHVARLLRIDWTEYATRWNEISSILSPDAIRLGAFDRFVGAKRSTRGTAEVDDAILAEIEEWRAKIARNLALRNRHLTQEVLDFAVQRTIDRILFLRIAEDRGIEEYGRLQELMEGHGTYVRLVELFRLADQRFNSGLFHFQHEDGRTEAPDSITSKLKIDDVVIRGVIQRLYPPDSPYEFSVLPTEILGHVYEQFLGKVIRLGSSRRVRVEDKPEIRKAGGVYYTPSYIVDDIVHRTVGALVDGLTPKDVSRLRVLDPACGSGSFLIGAYQFLLDWHLTWYVGNEPEARARQKEAPIIGDSKVGWRLSTGERKRVLTNNIFGVDVDSQAVEVTKLSLLLKVLEGETHQTLERQMAFVHERALPDLGRNIKCGNSIIGTDFLFGRTMRDVASGERRQASVFDWTTEFPTIIGAGGFDVVIGNPPYVLLQELDVPEVARYLQAAYRSARYKIDTYHVFIERSVGLLRERGILGFITPISYLRNKHARELRRFLLSATEIVRVCAFGYPVFHGASVDTSILVVRRTRRPDAKNQVQVAHVTTFGGVESQRHREQRAWADHPNSEFSLSGGGVDDAVLKKLSANATPLGEFATAYFGIQTRDRTRFVGNSRRGSHWKPAIDGANISRYSLDRSTEYVDFRPVAIKSGGKASVYESERIGIRQIGASPVSTLLPAGTYSLNTIYNVYFTKSTQLDLRFVLGVLCSRICQWYWNRCNSDEKRLFPKIKKAAILGVPVPSIRFDVLADRKAHDRVVLLVNSMLELQIERRESLTEAQRTDVMRRIHATDAKLEEEVAARFGLSASDIAVIAEPALLEHA